MSIQCCKGTFQPHHGVLIMETVDMARIFALAVARSVKEWSWQLPCHVHMHLIYLLRSKLSSLNLSGGKQKLENINFRTDWYWAIFDMLVCWSWGSVVPNKSEQVSKRLRAVLHTCTTHIHNFIKFIPAAEQLPWIPLGMLAVADLPPRSVYLRPQDEMWFLHPWVAHRIRRTILRPVFLNSISASDISSSFLWLEHQWLADKIHKTHAGQFDVGLYVGHPCFVKSRCLSVGPYANELLKSCKCISSDTGATGGTNK